MLRSYPGLAARSALAPRSPQDPEVKLDPAASANPPTTPPEAAAKQPDLPAVAAPKDLVKKVHVVWAAPGHEVFGIGMMLRVPGDIADSLRSAGRARPASESEIKAAKAGKIDVPDLDGI